MNLNERLPVSEELKELMALFKFPRTRLVLKGSAVIGGQENFSDYDFFTELPDCPHSQLYKFFKRLLTILRHNPKLFFIELKIQGHRKIRHHPGDSYIEDVFYKDLQGASFVKVDIVSFIDKIATEASCIYSLKQLPQTQEEYKKEIEEDVRELKNEGKWFKVLKREFSLARVNGEEEKAIKLLSVFNTQLGQTYKIISSLEACQLVKKYYDADKLIDISLKEVGVPSDYLGWMNQKQREMNETARLIYQDLNK